MLMTQAGRFSYTRRVTLLCPREMKDGKDFVQMFLTSCGLEMTLWSHYIKIQQIYHAIYTMIQVAGSVSNLSPHLLPQFLHCYLTSIPHVNL